MSSTPNSSDVVRTTLAIHELLTAPYIPLSEAAMREVGSAAQTLGGLYKITGKETFVPIHDIALSARVRQRTCEKQLKRLHESGWVHNRGRERTRAGCLRRTATHALTLKAKKHKSPFLRLPYWAAVPVGRTKLSWKARAVLAVVTSQYNVLVDSPGLEAYSDEQGLILEEFEDRFRFSLSRLQRQTGLQRNSVVEAKRELHEAGIITWRGSGQNVDLVLPNPDYQITRIDDHARSVFWLEEA